MSHVVSTILRSMALSVLAMSGFLVCGCMQPLTQSEIKNLETRELSLPYDNAYKAAANGLFSLGFAVEHSDKASGILTGQRIDKQAGKKVAAGIMFGVIGVLATGNRTETVTFMVTPANPVVTNLRMKVIIDGKQVTDREFMTKIWQQIEREGMLDSGPSSRPAATQPAATQPAQPVASVSCACAIQTCAIQK